MKVDRTQLKSERVRRAWSQGHLARAAGLSTRTVQRIEKTGSASMESAISLAAALSVEVSDLKAAQSTPRHRTGLLSSRVLTGSAFGMMLMALSFIGVNSAFAEKILLDFEVSQSGLSGNEPTQASGRMLTADGKAAELRLEGNLKLLIVPTVESDGSVRFVARIFEFSNGGYVLSAEPELVTADRKQAEIRLVSVEGTKTRILLTPYRDRSGS